MLRSRTCRSSCRHFKNMPRQNMRSGRLIITRFFYTKKNIRHLNACKSDVFLYVFRCFAKLCRWGQLHCFGRCFGRFTGAWCHVRQKSLQGTMEFHQKLTTKPMFHALKQDHLGSRIGDQKWCLFQVEINVWYCTCSRVSPNLGCWKASQGPNWHVADSMYAHMFQPKSLKE